MKQPVKMLAFDFGASSGRAILGILENDKLRVEEIHRFSNDPVEINGSLYWDILRLFHEVKQGILKCTQLGHRDISSIAADTWGVDFGLLDEQGNMLGNPYHYRDKRTNGMMDIISEIIPKEELYKITGIECMWFNTILQIFSMKHSNSPQLKEAKTLLLMPDLFNYFLTGVQAVEYSVASTTQLLDAYGRTWSDDIIKRLGLPREIFAEIVQPGTQLGLLTEGLAKELGVPRYKVVTTASHDTQSAIVAVPANDEDFVYISCGTWSLMGVESDTPLINEKSSRLAITNEGGVGGKITLLKNIMGFWLIQECRRQWEKEGQKFSYAELESMAYDVKPLVSFIDPDHHSFIAPGDMPERIKEFCRGTNQQVPEIRGEIVRCIAQSLAFKYRSTVESLEEVRGESYPVIHMVGGGIKDTLLCQLTANATGRKVVAGPVEATSVGNLLIQAMALGKIKNLQHIRQIVRNSFETREYLPEETGVWDKEYERYKQVVSKT